MNGTIFAPGQGYSGARAGQPVLMADHLRKDFPLSQMWGGRRTVQAVEDASLTLYTGQATALVGESGSGKTTVARMLAGMHIPTRGRLLFRESEVDLRRASERNRYIRQVQYMFQDPFSSLNPVHSIRYHLSRPLRRHGHARSAAEVEAQSLALLEKVSLTPARQFLDKYPHQLSGGQRQRISIARSLAVGPSVVLADEPVSMLDVSIRLDILNLLLKLKEEEGLAFLFITHDIASARYFAEQTQVMYAGQMVEGGPSEEVIRRPRHPYTRLLRSAAPNPDRLVKGAEGSANGAEVVPERGEPPGLINPPAGCRFHLRCSHAMEVCRQTFPARTDFGGGHWTHCHLYPPTINPGITTFPQEAK
ncbi:MAG TPA: ABC transporter ATP-binding protein [Ktedonobacteraceae bacterium]